MRAGKYAWNLNNFFCLKLGLYLDHKVPMIHFIFSNDIRYVIIL